MHRDLWVKTSQNRAFLASTEHANLIFTSTLERSLADKSQTIEEKEAFMFTDERVLETQPAVKASVALKMAARGRVTVCHLSVTWVQHVE